MVRDIQRLAADPALRLRLGAAGRSYVQAEHSQGLAEGRAQACSTPWPTAAAWPRPRHCGAGDRDAAGAGGDGPAAAARPALDTGNDAAAS